MTSHVVPLRISDEMKDRLDKLSLVTNRSATAIAMDALEDYLWQREQENEALNLTVERANKGNFVSHDAVAGWLKSWGTDKEQAAPAPDIVKRR